MSLTLFHPAVSNWFENTFSKPTDIQDQAWPEIKKNNSVLIAAPTGSGKTLAAFLGTIDNLIREGIEGRLLEQTLVVYISPLKALSNDIEKNLQIPLQGIEQALQSSGYPEVKLKVAVRTGDTELSQRASMLKSPPHILVTTPESLYLMLTSVKGRHMLSSVHTVIIDEIHAMVGNKRGTHLALSLERLEALVKRKMTRIGISATQKPMEKVAGFLMGRGRTCTIIDTGHKRAMQLSIEVPASPLTAVMSHEVWGEIYERLAELIQQHKTTLIFVNTRRLAERLAFHLSERLGAEIVTAHHGSMSKDLRLDAERRLKAGALKVLVATASLELGIDIGDVDLVCQIGSTRSIATLLQRVGRSGHTIKETPKGIIFPLSRDELVECAAILDAIRRGELDQILMPEKPLDVLAQQIVAEVASDEWEEDKLFEMVKQAYPYRDLTGKEFEEVIRMLAEGYTTRRGKRGAYIFHDIVNRKLRGRKGARLTALVNGGAIPDSFDYDVIQEPENIFIGTLNEDFAIESLAGDIFQLGNSSYKVLRVENGKVKVEDAKGQPPSLPFWLGEVPGRTTELSYAVSRLREEISERLGDISDFLKENRDEELLIHTWKTPAMDWLINEVGVSLEAADQMVMYLATIKAALGVIPTQDKIVLERFFDEAGDMHLVVHAPFGNRFNRGWGLSLRKRFCKKFNFELQAAATEDAIILSLGSTHSFPLEEVFHYLKPPTVREVLIQALLDSPIFEIRWRWNASIALAVLRRRAGDRVAPQIQRMQSEDLVALIFPDQLACFENIQGEREVPDHPLVNQTIHDCLTEAMDIESLKAVLQRIADGAVELISKDLKEPSPLSQEILNARPYAFLDDAPLEERRTRAVASRRWLDPAEARDLGTLDLKVIETVKSEVWPQASNKDELHDALCLLGYLTREEAIHWDIYFKELVEDGRAISFTCSSGRELWISIERVPLWNAIDPSMQLLKRIQLPESIRNIMWERPQALKEIIRGRMEVAGPVTEKMLSDSMEIPVQEVVTALLSLESEGFIFRGSYTPDQTETEWCERRILARIHRYTLLKLRKEIEAVSPADFMRFLFHWHHIIPGIKPEGPHALEEVLTKLEGYEAAAAAWESDIFPARLKDYDHTWLDMLCLSGKVLWGRFRVPQIQGKKVSNPIKTTPVTFISRVNRGLWKEMTEKTEGISYLTHEADRVYDFLQTQGASFFNDIVEGTGLLTVQVEEAIAELVSSGVVTSDSYTGLRALLVPSKYRLESGRRREVPFKMEQAGRWSLMKSQEDRQNTSDRIALIAQILLKRYGVVFRKLADHEMMAPPWRDLVKVYRIMEARGEIRGGRFVDGVWGEQFALPEALTQLRQLRKQEKNGMMISISASDPLNLQGVLSPGKKVVSFPGNRVLYKDGVVIAVQEGGKVQYLEEVQSQERWKVQQTLIQRDISPKLRSYLGRGIL